MPRNASGQYELPHPINPVQPLTTIATSWANPTMQDIADALTDSLSRTGLGGMSVTFKLQDGTVLAPGLSFNNEPGLGLYRPATNQMSVADNGAEIFRFTPTGIHSLVELSGRTFVSVRTPGARNYAMHNSTNGNLYFSPSASIDGIDWNFGMGLTINGASGLVAASNSFQVGLNATIGQDLVVNRNVAFYGSTSLGQLNSTGITNTYDISCRELYAANKVRGQAFFHTTVPNYGLSGSVVFDYNVAQVFTCGVAAAATLSFINIPVGGMMRVIIGNFYSGYLTIAGVIWPNNTAPPIQGGPNLLGVLIIINSGGALLASLTPY